MLIQSIPPYESSSRFPNILLPWLDHQGSMTEKLRSMAGEAELTVINQDWTTPSWWDLFVLGLEVPAIRQREILMSAGSRPCWYARTIIPDYTWQARESLLKRLVNETLTNIIFGENGVKRYSLINYAINSECIEYYWMNPILTKKATPLWVRLSVFTIDTDFPFYLMEILLPGLLDYCDK